MAEGSLVPQVSQSCTAECRWDEGSSVMVWDRRQWSVIVIAEHFPFYLMGCCCSWETASLSQPSSPTCSECLRQNSQRLLRQNLEPEQYLSSEKTVLSGKKIKKKRKRKRNNLVLISLYSSAVFYLISAGWQDSSFLSEYSKM